MQNEALEAEKTIIHWQLLIYRIITEYITFKQLDIVVDSGGACA